MVMILSIFKTIEKLIKAVVFYPIYHLMYVRVIQYRHSFFNFLGHGICNNFSKSVTLPMATDDAKIVCRETMSLLKQLKAAAEDLRGVGLLLIGFLIVESQK